MTSSSNNPPASFATYRIQSPIPPGRELSPTQALLACSVLDLFAGHPTKRKLSLWTDAAAFVDPLTAATGRKQFEAQWYGLKATMSAIDVQHAEVTSAGNPLEVQTKVKYTVKGIGKDQVIESTVLVHTSEDGEKITKVEDRWGGDVPPEGVFAKVSFGRAKTLFPHRCQRR